MEGKRFDDLAVDRWVRVQVGELFLAALSKQQIIISSSFMERESSRALISRRRRNFEGFWDVTRSGT